MYFEFEIEEKKLVIVQRVIFYTTIKINNTFLILSFVKVEMENNKDILVDVEYKKMCKDFPLYKVINFV